MSTVKTKSILYLLAFMAVCLGPGATARADQIVFQATFNQPSSVYPSPAGPTLGNPDTLYPENGTVYYVGGNLSDPTNPCVAAGGTNAYCLQLPVISGTVPEIESTDLFYSGNYEVTLQIAGGTATTLALVQLGNADPITVTANSPFSYYYFTPTIPYDEAAHLLISGSGFYINSITITELSSSSLAPEPESWALIGMTGLGLAGVVGYRRRNISGLRKRD